MEPHGCSSSRFATRVLYGPSEGQTEGANQGQTYNKECEKVTIDGGRGAKDKCKTEGETKGEIGRHREGPIDPIHPGGKSPATEDTTAHKYSRACNRRAIEGP